METLVTSDIGTLIYNEYTMDLNKITPDYDFNDFMFTITPWKKKG